VREVEGLKMIFEMWNPFFPTPSLDLSSTMKISLLPFLKTHYHTYAEVMCYVSSCVKGSDHYRKKGGMEGRKLALVDAIMWSMLLHRVTKESQKKQSQAVILAQT
jgi:hypothetical protein